MQIPHQVGLHAKISQVLEPKRWFVKKSLKKSILLSKSKWELRRQIWNFLALDFLMANNVWRTVCAQLFDFRFSQILSLVF